VAVVVIARTQPDSVVGRYVAEAEVFARALPDRARTLVRDARDRFALATAAFHEARAQSQRALASQLEEAKHRGSMPPI
jgi:predicted sulfurtransferase